MDVTLTAEECRAVVGLIGLLSGHNPENVFSWDGTDDPREPLTSACAKLYRAAGHRVPDSCLHTGRPAP